MAALEPVAPVTAPVTAPADPDAVVTYDYKFQPMEPLKEPERDFGLAKGGLVKRLREAGYH